MSALLETRGLSVGYSGSEVLGGLDLVVEPGEVVALLGANGAGKTTTMLSLVGELAPLGGEVEFFGRRSQASLHRLARRGVSFVGEERTVFTRLSTRQNIGLGGCEAGRVVELFPELEEKLDRRAGLLSGGEQQMLALGRAVSRKDMKLLLADELSLGLAPKLVDRLLRAVRAAADRGAGALLVEQHVHRVLEIADRVYVVAQGRVQMAGSASEARERIDEIQGHYIKSGQTPTRGEKRE